MREAVQKIIESEIDPMLALHSGNCELVGIEDGVVSIKLSGGCVGCPSSKITLYQGIVPILRQHIPTITDVLLVL